MQYLNFLTGANDFEFFKNYVSRKNSKKQTILFYFLHDDDSGLIKILNWFKTAFKNDENFLEKILLEVDENSDSFLTFVLKKYERLLIHDFFAKTYDFLLKNFDKVFVKELLLLQNNDAKNFLNIICERFKRGYVWNITFILDTLFEDFQNDRDFFAELINEKSKKNRKVKDFMKNKLKIDLSGRSDSCKIS